MSALNGKKASMYMVISWAVAILFLFLVFKVATGFLSGGIESDRSSNLLSGIFYTSTNDSGSYETNDTPSIVMLDVDGVIDAKRAEQVTEAYKILEDDDNVLGVILRVNSPGGGVSSSERIRRAGERFSEKKPLYAAVYEVGASGGYMSSLPAEKIYSYPTALVGSIGVIAESVEATELFDKIGLNYTVSTTGQYKATGYLSHELTQAEIDNTQELIDSMFDEFVKNVMDGRNMSEAEVRAIAEGQVFTGTQAIKNGLIDEIGDYDDAFEAMKMSMNLTDEERDEINMVEYKYPATRNYPSIYGAASAVIATAKTVSNVFESSSQSTFEYKMR